MATPICSGGSMGFGENKVMKNAAWIISCKLMQAVIQLVITMLTARYLGPSDYGSISYAASVVAFVVPVMQLGLRNTLVQEFVNAPQKEGEILGTALGLSLLSSVACIGGVVAFASVANFNDTETIWVCGLYSISLIFQALEMTQYWFQAKLLSKYTSVVMLSAYVLVALYRIVLLWRGKDIYWFAIATSIEYAAVAAGMFAIYQKNGGQQLRFSWKLGKQMLARSKYYIVANLMVTVFAQTDRVMLRLMIDETATGFYSAAITCANMVSFVFYAIIDSARPSIFENKKKDTEDFHKSVSLLYSVIIYCSLATCVVITVFAKLIVAILYGKAYYAAIPLLRIVVWYTTFSHLGSVRNIWILAESKQDKLWIINLSGAVLNVVLNFGLIPSWGAAGAAFASLMTQVFSNFILGFIIPAIRFNNTLLLRGMDPRPMVNLGLDLLRVRRQK